MALSSGSASVGAAPVTAPSWPLVRRIAAEPATALLLQRALVMEVAHPKVAAAVANHSGFRSQPWRRALSTLSAGARIVFGDDATARATVRRIQHTHDHVHGSLHRSATATADEDRYSAHDPALLCWVWATLVDTTELAYTRWVRAFDDGEADAFHTEMRALGRFLGIPDEVMPASRREQRAYLDAMLDGPELGATPVSRELARQVLFFRHVLVPAPVVQLERALALTTLDRRLLERLQLRPSAIDSVTGWWCDGVLRNGYRLLPGVRSVPLPAGVWLTSVLGALPGLGRNLGRRPYTAPA